MSLEFQSVTFLSEAPARDASFWSTVLGRSARDDAGGILLAGDARQVGIRFAAGPGHGGKRNRLHLHLSRVDRNQSETIAACVEHGGRLRGNGHVPEGSYAAMADVVDDEFCVIEDDDGYLAGCGPLGEVTCEGTRATGEFWSKALDWPVVWDRGEEVAIQAPAGGTKLAWSGEPIETGKPTDRQYFTLVASWGRFDDELERLRELGATDPSSERPGVASLRDPDGVRFVVRASSEDDIRRR